ncbi:MAG: DNA polymerase III subunit delta' [Comamonadaceae bacterium]|mgnify:FL=1|jgi:DNA polymerase-3 subunit delta'|uniref:DNA polymerase III subunit delta' n=1 Tax=Candidatus Skiveiella danica TaxID=3386177 RepID=UPI001B57F40B|nr:DNA polymerase III subunit delta' [Comamonadaceae bacterium]MBK9196929.1 DNA polymerase III subunit delta' [Betaproteobacteria bacterium]MBP7966397.1 DNA polymerase III subunit delta' [Burkholderiaceae bacterium]MBP8789481.1 hypothetical protein [Azonexus sp.]MBK7508542.1 DNA polymerase III subunit delta' [Comamonadaceae bacterium]
MTAGLAMAPWVADQARLLLAQNGHAWLLHGPSGLGQYDLALSLASAWLCDQPSGEGACGHCGSCHAIDVRTHADLAVLMPETVLIERGWPLGEKAQAEIDDKKRKASREIRVEAMRETIEFSQRTSARGRAKVVLVYPAERMNHVTANALLKTLEEPPGDVKFVLATEASHLLLPTIRSRCMGHAMAWPEMSAALDWLAAQGFPPADARALLRIAGGRPDDALLLGRSGPPAESWPRLPRALARGDVGALSGFTPAQAITVLQKLCHDLLSQGCGAPPRFFDAADLPETSARMSIARLSGWAQSLARAARTAEHPFNPGLALEDLATQAHHIFHLP